MKEISEIIKSIQQDWVEAKASAQFQCEKENRFDMARKLSVCSMFRGTEDLQELINLMFSAKGAEFLTSYNFPSLATFRKFKKYDPERFGVYIDCGKIALSEPRRAFLVGNTTAEIKCEETALNRIITMCGAKANIQASGYSVIKIEQDNTSQVNCTIYEHAKVLR